MLSDSYEYVSLAEDLHQRGEFDSLLRTPVYPAFIATVYTLFGVDPLKVLLVQILLDSTSVLLIYWLAAEQKGKLAWLSAFFWAVNPAAIIYSNRLMSETLFIFILLCLVSVLLKFHRTQKNRTVILTGLTLGLLALTRPVAQYMLLLILLYLFLTFRVDKKRFLVVSCGVVFGYALAVTPWMVRNKIVYDRLVISSAGEYNLFARFAAYTIAWRDGMLFPEAEDILLKQAANREGQQINGRDFYHDPILHGKLKKMAVEILVENWPWFVAATAQGIALTMILPPVGMGEMQKLISDQQPVHEYKLYTLKTSLNDVSHLSLFGKLKNRLAAMPVSVIVVWVLGVIYLISFYVFIGYGLLTGKTMMSAYSAILLLLGLYLIIIPGPMGLARFRLVAEPLLLGGVKLTE